MAAPRRSRNMPSASQSLQGSPVTFCPSAQHRTLQLVGACGLNPAVTISIGGWQQAVTWFPLEFNGWYLRGLGLVSGQLDGRG